jgi:uncharacterized protein YecE (DUF72 family)
MVAMHPISVGCCGWSYDDWCGVFYPAKLPDRERLSFYARHYPIVEVDGTFYRSPSPATVEDWRDKTPPTFGFSLKVPKTVTHEKRLVGCRAELGAFLSAARLLGDKLRCVVLQFSYQNRTAFAGLKSFLALLDPFLGDWPAGVPVAVEIRNKGWVTPDLLDCLRRHNAAYVVADHTWMPAPLDLVQKLDLVTGPFSYFRLLGDREQVDALTKTLDRLVMDRSDQIEADARAVKMLAERVPVMTFTNNHYEGHGPETARRFGRALAGGT